MAFQVLGEENEFTVVIFHLQQVDVARYYSRV